MGLYIYIWRYLMLSGYRMTYVVILDGFSYDDVKRIAKDFDLTIEEVTQLYERSKSAREFEKGFVGLIR